MAKKTTKRPGKKPVRKPVTRSGKAITVWIDHEIALSLKRFLSESEPKVKQTAAVEIALKEYLRKKGYYPPPSEQPVPTS